MGTKHEIVCLAASRKFNGTCVAGVTAGGVWLRPVGKASDGALTTAECVLDDGSELSVLDVVELTTGKYRGTDVHPEDYEMSSTPRRRVGHLSASEAAELLDSLAVDGPEILGGTGDRITADEARERRPGSLAVVMPETLKFRVKTSYRGHDQARAMFTLSGAYYDLTLTDPEWDARVKAAGRMTHDYADLSDAPDSTVYLTISLTEPFEDGICYRLVAAVIELPE